MKLPPIIEIGVAANDRSDDARWRLNWLIGLWFGWTWSRDTNEWLSPDGDIHKQMPDFVQQLSTSYNLSATVYKPGTRVLLVQLDDDDLDDGLCPIKPGDEGVVYEDREQLNGPGIAVKWFIDGREQLTAWTVPAECLALVRRVA
jgi:hypothetical protein